MRFLTILLTVLFIATNLFAQDVFDHKLAQARRLVQERSYAEALKIYSEISDGLAKDPGLIIEWARVYTYADEHAPAIKLFEKVRQGNPEYSGQFLRELADQYRWNGQISMSNAVYTEALRLKPFDTELLLGQADLLSSQDKLEEAYILCQRVLEREPENLNALNAQAKILVWQGYHRQGFNRYEEILKKHPDNLDALEGKAFALHWMGNNPGALRTLDELFALKPDRKEAEKLYSRIKNSQHPFLRSGGRFSRDSTPQTVATGAIRTGMHLNYSNSVDAIYEHQELNKKGALIPHLSADRRGLGLSSRFSDAYALNAFVYQTHFTKADFNPVTANSWLTYQPDDYWRFDLSYERETFEDNDAVFYKIITNSPAISADFRPDRFWLFNFKYKRSYFNDDNRQNQFFGKIEYRLWHKPYLKLFYNYYYSGWGEPELSHGYFNPRTLRAHSLGAYTGLELIKRMFFEAKAAGGYEFQRKPDNAHKKSDHPTCYLAASLNYRIKDNWLLSASGDFFTTWPDHGQRSYQKKGVYLSITYNFGASPVAVGDAARPYRSTGAN